MSERATKTASCAYWMILLCLLTACGSDHSAEEMALGRTKAGVGLLCEALDYHRVTYGSLPTQSQSLEVMIEERARSKTNPALMDGWRRPMHAVISGTSIVGVYSAGPNGKDERGAGDDIACKVGASR